MIERLRAAVRTLNEQLDSLDRVSLTVRHRGVCERLGELLRVAGVRLEDELEFGRRVRPRRVERVQSVGHVRVLVLAAVLRVQGGRRSGCARRGHACRPRHGEGVRLPEGSVERPDEDVAARSTHRLGPGADGVETQTEVRSASDQAAECEAKRGQPVG